MDYYKFIRPKRMTPRKPLVAVGRDAVMETLGWLLETKPAAVHYDLETTGLDYANPHQFITNVGLAMPDYLVGLDLTCLTFEEQERIWNWLAKQPLGGFNLGFDLAWPWRTPTTDGRVMQDLDNLRVVSDTSLWFRLLATEGHFRQSYTLETAIETILQWPGANQQKAWLKDALAKHGLSKDQMYKLSVLEPNGYTHYCALDAEASYQLDMVFNETLDHWEFGGLRQYHDTILVPKVKRNILATSHGIPVDRDKLARNIEWCQRRLLWLEAKALAHDDVRPYIAAWEERKLANQHTLKYNLKKVWAKKSDEPWTKPDEYRLETALKLDKLPAWCQEFGGKFYKPETQFSISGQSKEWPRFNVNSPDDMKYLIYTCWLDNQYDVWYKDPDNPKYGGLVKVRRGGKQYEVELTDTGGLPTGGDILTLFGEAGKMLNEYKKLKKLLGDFLEKFYVASERTGHIHAQGKVLGTITGRMSGGNAL